MSNFDAFEMYQDLEAECYEERDLRQPDRYDAIAARYDEIIDGLIEVMDTMSRRKLATRTITPSVIIFN